MRNNSHLINPIEARQAEMFQSGHGSRRGPRAEGQRNTSEESAHTQSDLAGSTWLVFLKAHCWDTMAQC